MVTAGEKLQTFSAAGDEDVTDRVKLEEKSRLKKIIEVFHRINVFFFR